MYLRSYIVIDEDRMRFNIKHLMNKSQKKLIGVIKANGYGVGDFYSAKILASEGVELLAVSSFDEAKRLRDYGIENEILILGYVEKEDLKYVKDYNFSILTVSKEYIMNNISLLENVKIHIKINTGMNRIGINPSELEEIFNILKDKANIEGIMSHYACADNNYVETKKQYDLFKECLNSLKYDFRYIHISASDGIFMIEDDISTHVRCGIGILGYSSFESELKPCVSLYSVVTDCKKINKGEGISYGHNYISDGEGYILTLPIGYADGVLRKNTGKQVYIDGEYGTIVGNICMDQLMVKTNNAYPIGTKVEIFGKHIDISKRAKELDTINYELLVDLSDRLARVYKYNDEIVEINKPRFI